MHVQLIRTKTPPNQLSRDLLLQASLLADQINAGQHWTRTARDVADVLEREVSRLRAQIDHKQQKSVTVAIRYRADDVKAVDENGDSIFNLRIDRTPAQKYVVYYRVSTARQGRSGLGLDAQRQIVEQYLQNNPGHVVAEFQEVESGKRSDRPQLAAAIEQATSAGAKLLVAKLDRLARSVSFIFALRENDVDFVACDLPEFNTLTIGIFATVGQYEREMISKRTRDALQAKKRRGEELGNPNGWTAQAQRKATETKKRRARTNLNTRKVKQRLQEVIELAQFKNQTLTIEAVADRLNSDGLRTTRGKQFTKSNVRYLLDQVLQEMDLQQLPKATADQVGAAA